jgi:CheY-like chemotaxis protein
MTESKTILLIDDDTDIHDVIKTILEPLGYRIECALTGPAGMEAAQKLKPALILLDVMLDSPSEGFHLAYEFKQDDQLKNTPIVIISSVGKTMGIDYSKELGTEYVPVDRFLDKPFDAATLRSAVENAIAEAGG